MMCEILARGPRNTHSSQQARPKLPQYSERWSNTRRDRKMYQCVAETIPKHIHLQNNGKQGFHFLVAQALKSSFLSGFSTNSLQFTRARGTLVTFGRRRASLGTNSTFWRRGAVSITHSCISSWAELSTMHPKHGFVHNYVVDVTVAAIETLP